MDGHDVPDFTPTLAPDAEPAEGATGPAALAGTDAFVMQADGKAWLYAPAGLTDGPLPAHYEPQESPVRNPLYRQQRNPARQVTDVVHPENRYPPVVTSRARTSTRTCSAPTGSPSTTPRAG